MSSYGNVEQLDDQQAAAADDAVGAGTGAGAATGEGARTLTRSGVRWARYRAAAGGLDEYWYPVTEFDRLRRKKSMKIQLVGRKLVLVYDQGRCYALLDECPHRQVPLSMGRREFPGHITCIYHGWTFDLASGRMVAALTDGPDSPIRDKVCVRTFPVEVRIGQVFVWMGEGDPVPVEDDIPAELLQADARIYPLARDVGGNWRHATENGFDESHVKMLHRSSLWVTFRNISAWNMTTIEKSDDQVWLTRVQDSVHMFDQYPGLGEWPKRRRWKPLAKDTGSPGGKDHAVAVRLPCILRVRQPGPADWTHYEWYVPIDADRYHYLVLAVTWRKSRAARLRFWLRYWTYILWIHHYGFNNQDLAVVAATPESAPARQFRPDVSIIAWREHLEANARRPRRTGSKRPPVPIVERKD